MRFYWNLPSSTACKSVLSFWIWLLLALALHPAEIEAQQPSPAPVDAAQIFLAAIALKYPAAASLHSVSLQASATWTVGGLKETGTAVLQAQADGSSSMQLNLDQATRTESRKALGNDRACLWADSKGTHQLNDVDCNASLSWFAPLFGIQPVANVLSLLTVFDGGTVTRNVGALRKISYQTTMPSPSADTAKFLTTGTQMNVLYDPKTLLPSSLEYLQHGDTDLNTTFPVRIVYSNYQLVDGMPMPYRIDRYVNGLLQLSLTISSATLK